MADQAQPDRESQVGAPQATPEDRLASMETQLESLGSQAKGREQKVLELETCELIANRLMGWAKLFGFFVCIPIAVLLVVMGLILGKGLKDLNELTVTTRNSLQPLLKDAQTRADEAKNVAVAAQRDADNIQHAVKTTGQGISDLQNQVTLGLQSLQELTKQMEEAGEGVKQLRARVTESSGQVSQLSRQVEVVSNEKNLSTLRKNYPVFGERVVMASTGQLVDVQEKKPEDVYISLVVSMPMTISPSQRKVNDTDIAAAVTALQSAGYTVFTGGIGLYARAENTSTGMVHTSSQNCTGPDITPPIQAPCILYFRHGLEAVVEKTKQMLTPAQAIPDESIRYVEPVKSTQAMQELLEKSGLDIVIVLGQ